MYRQGIMVVFSPMQLADTGSISRQGLTISGTLNSVCKVVGYSARSGPMGDQCHYLML